MSKENKRYFRKANKLHICNKSYSEKDITVRNQCHLTGEYIGSGHQICNANFRPIKKIPAIVHNLRGYDGHLTM